MTPGTYLRKRREAAGVTGEGIGFAVDEVEVDGATITLEHLIGYEAAGVSFDRDILIDLVAGEPAQVCRVCGCSWHDPCDQACDWAEHDLCTACVGKEQAAA